nr:MAG TPA: hypothetical protein [Caudoviricetes sp.]
MYQSNQFHFYPYSRHHFTSLFLCIKKDTLTSVKMPNLEL